MWLPGHLAFSFILCLPLVIYLKRERALALVTIGVFALLPDVLHLGMLRAFSHSVVGVAIMLALTLIPLVLLFRPRAAILLTAILATAGHMVADFYIGTVWPFYPWDQEWWQIHQFNTPFDIRVEVTLSVIALLFLLALGPIRSLLRINEYDHRERSLTALLAAASAALALLQGGYFLLVSPHPDLLRTALLALMGFAFLASVAVLLFAWRSGPSYAR